VVFSAFWKITIKTSRIATSNTMILGLNEFLRSNDCRSHTGECPDGSSHRVPT
jgi:hypothetical protein